MKQMSETIVFFGSGPVAAASLAFLAEKFNIEAVVTKPRPPHHRGEVPVLDLAEKLQLPIHTAQNQEELDTLVAAQPFTSRLAILVDFGIIVSQTVIDYFPLGIVNSHFSLLPEWRGADPISFAVLSGQPTTGVTLMLLTAGLDEGPVLAMTEVDISAESTTPSLTTTLIQTSNEALETIVPKYVSGELQPISQETLAAQMKRSAEPTYSRKLTKEDSLLDWTKPAAQLEREVRAFTGWPSSRTTLAGKDVTVTKASVSATPPNTKPGDITVQPEGIAVTTSEGAFVIERLKPSGKREMSAKEFLAGNKL